MRTPTWFAAVALSVLGLAACGSDPVVATAAGGVPASSPAPPASLMPSAPSSLSSLSLSPSASAGVGADAGASTGADARTGVSAGSFNAADVTFVTGMKPHHQQAVTMADMVLRVRPDAEVAALARAIKAAQVPEIAQLDRMLTLFEARMVASHGPAGTPTTSGGHGGGAASSGAAPHSYGPAGGDHGASGGAPDHGMLSETDLQTLGSATGGKASQLFLQGMTQHHRGAIAMAKAEVDVGTHPEAVALAKSISTGQQKELTEISRLLARQ